MDHQVVLITGASKGIGRKTAEVFRAHGYEVYDLSRSGSDADGIHAIHCDVSVPEDVDRAVAEVLGRAGRIDVVVSNAGFGISGSVEGHAYDAIKRQIDVNFLGAAYVAKAVLPAIRESGGRILFLSSVAACVPIPFQALYSATKAAVMTLAMALDNELMGSGARSVALLPGDLRTNFTRARVKNRNEADFYAARVTHSVEKMEHDEENGMDPIVVAERLYALATAKNPKAISSVGFLYRTALVLAKGLPVRWQQWIIARLYA